MKNRRKAATLLVADDDTVALKLIGFNFDQAGLFCEMFESGDALLEEITEDTQTCLLDLNMPGRDGLECLKQIKTRYPYIEVVILTNVNQAAEAVAAVRGGAFDYVTKPFDPNTLVKTVRKAMQLSRKQRENQDLRDSLSEPVREARLLGDSPTMQRVKKLVARIGPSESSVLLTGESGTGKTLLARVIHQTSARREGPFVSVSCPSLPGDLLESEMFGHEKGAFSGAVRRRLGRAELANGGTLFLDEIGEMPLRLQTKLLTFLQDRSFFRLGGEVSLQSDVRIIAATNRDLQEMVAQGGFREDLYFRLNVLPLEVPPLRERNEDIPAFVDYFLARNAEVDTGNIPNVESSVYRLLEGANWPGNIRELENAVARAYTLRGNEDCLETKDFGFLSSSDSKSYSKNGFREEMSFQLAGKTLAEIESEAIKETIVACGGNKSEAARTLGIAEKSIYNKIKKYDLSL